MILTGHSPCKLDAKWRLLMPSTFLQQLGKVEPEARFVIKKDIYKKCLNLYPIAEWEHFIGRIRKKINPFNKQHSEFLTQFHRDTAELNIDANNRLTLPKRLLDEAGITGEVELVGVGGNIEIWDKTIFEASKMPEDLFGDLAQSILGDNFNLED